jgi:predicted DsbA family dithiol-disulfide isomerase
MPEFRGRVTLRMRSFPLELIDGESAPRDILDQEWWLAAIQEPRAAFAPFRGDDWPTTTLPTFEAAWCAGQQGNDTLIEYDLRVRQAFFKESRNIGRWDVLHEIAEEVGLDRQQFERDIASGIGHPAVVEEARLGREQYRVGGTPTLMLSNGTTLDHPLAEPHMEDRKIVSVPPLPCFGEACLEVTRTAIDQALLRLTDTAPDVS